METTESGAGELGRPGAAGAGAVGAAVALLGATLAWPGEPVVPIEAFGSPAAALLAVLALSAFLGRRWGLLGRDVASPVAAVAGLALSVLAAVRLVAPAIDAAVVPSVGPGLWLTMVAGIVCVGLAIADYRGTGAAELTTMGRRVALAFVLTVGGFIVLWMLSLPIRALIVDDFSMVLVSVTSPVASLGFVLVAVAFLRATDRGLGWLDVSKPSLRELAYAVAGVFVLLGVQTAVGLVTQSLGIPSSDNAIVDVARTAAEQGYAELFLLMVPISILVVGPAEEVLFRGVIQKHLYGPFSRAGAVLTASLVFAAAHVLSYWDPNQAAMFVSLSSVFGLALVLGTIYERTDNLVVPALVHGIYNAVLAVLLYVSAATGRLPDAAVLVLP